MVTADQQGEPFYEVGYKRPPKETRYQPGDRGNPKGRPRGSPNKKDLIERVLNKKILVRKGEKTTKVSLIEAITEAFALKAAEGDRHAANVVINLATKSGVLNGARDNSASSPVPEQTVPAREIRPSDNVVESLDDSLLSAEEKIEFSKLAERIDLAGDITALSGEEFVRWKQIVNKGRGKNVEPQSDGGPDQAT